MFPSNSYVESLVPSTSEYDFVWKSLKWIIKLKCRASQVELVVKNPPANAGDIKDEGSIPESERSPKEENGKPLQCSYLGNPMDREAWWATVHGIVKTRTRLNTHTCHTFTKYSKHS